MWLTFVRRPGGLNRKSNEVVWLMVRWEDVNCQLWLGFHGLCSMSCEGPGSSSLYIHFWSGTWAKAYDCLKTLFHFKHSPSVAVETDADRLS